MPPEVKAKYDEYYKIELAISGDPIRADLYARHETVQWAKHEVGNIKVLQWAAAEAKKRDSIIDYYKQGIEEAEIDNPNYTAAGYETDVLEFLKVDGVVYVSNDGGATYKKRSSPPMKPVTQRALPQHTIQPRRADWVAKRKVYGGKMRLKTRSEVKFPDISVKLVGEDGNVFNLIGLVTKALTSAFKPFLPTSKLPVNGKKRADGTRAFMEGQRANAEGKHKSSNPYEVGTREYRDWMQGFDESSFIRERTRLSGTSILFDSQQETNDAFDILDEDASIESARAHGNQIDFDNAADAQKAFDLLESRGRSLSAEQLVSQILQRFEEMNRTEGVGVSNLSLMPNNLTPEEEKVWLKTYTMN